MSDRGMTVLVAMDKTDHSEHAFQYYLKNVHKDSNYVIVVHAADHGGLATPPVFGGEAPQLERTEEEIDHFVSSLKEKLKLAAIKGVALRISDITPGEAIIKASKENKVDLIVVGKDKQLLKISASKYVLENSRIPVLIVF